MPIHGTGNGRIQSPMGDVTLPNQSGRSDLYDVPEVKTVDRPLRPGEKGMTVRTGTGDDAAEVRPDGATFRGAPYKTADGSKRVVHATKQDGI